MKHVLVRSAISNTTRKHSHHTRIRAHEHAYRRSDLPRSETGLRPDALVYIRHRCLFIRSRELPLRRRALQPIWIVTSAPNRDEGITFKEPFRAKDHLTKSR
jgi:hypothetical protein